MSLFSDNNLKEGAVDIIGKDDINALFPFHICFDRSLRVIRCGSSLLKIEPLLKKGAQLSDFFFH